jgi:preprotein translocase subunit SecA
MDHLRDGIGLRGYGQRDPKKEYKREGYDLFVQTLQNTKASVVEKLFGVQRLTEREVAEAEAQRRRQVEARQQAIQAQHPGEPPAAQQPQEVGQQPQPRVMIAARHSAVAQQAALQAQARRLAAMQQPQRPPQQAPQQAQSAQAQIADMQQRARQAAEAAARARAAQQVPQVRREAPKIGRNDPCHCGSGKKYKNCHMKDDLSAAGG